jgi:amino acid transporter/mannitol/fructose-specific phosphotransferase system IIA component (Ntr-type)
MADGLKKELKLFDVYAIATGAMFSSGFFMLPGLAAAQTGPSVFLAYFLSGIVILPTMFAMAELSPALPKAGGTYYIIDRALGPMVGSVGGYGLWIALILKSAFALIGMGAYLSIFFQVNITAVAVILTIAFGIINIIGAKETALLQRIMVSAIVVIMAFYIVQGVADFFSLGILDLHNERFTPFLTGGVKGLFATVGIVFVSYAGLTKVAGVAEEIENPDRNIPLGMFLSVATAVVVYSVGVFVMVAYLDPATFRADLHPVATAGEHFFLGFLPGPAGLIVVTIAAVAAFASTGNAGILAGSRAPFAMARDKLITSKFKKIGSRGTPTLAIICTVLIMVVILLVFNVVEVAELASAFQLLIFFLLNASVIVMRESRIESYDPAFKTPLYPWLPIAGMIFSVYLIIAMGILSIFFTFVISVFAVIWYYYYAYHRIDREGAIFHIHERLGRRKDYGLEHEMRGILREKGLRDEDPYEQIAGRAAVLDIDGSDIGYDEIVREVCNIFARKLSMDANRLYNAFSEKRDLGAIPIGQGAALKHIRVQEDISTEIVLVRIKKGLLLDKEHLEDIGREDGLKDQKLYAMIFLISSEKRASQHLRFLAHIVEMVDNKGFLKYWQDAEDEVDLRHLILRDERFISFTLERYNRTEKLIGKQIKDIDLPGESLINLLKRDGKIKIPHGDTQLKEGDRLLIVGETDDINELKKLDE